MRSGLVGTIIVVAATSAVAGQQPIRGGVRDGSAIRAYKGFMALPADQTRDAGVLVEQLRGLPAPSPAGGRTVRAPEEEQRWQVISNLRALGQPAVQALAAALTDDDVSLRRNALLALHFLAAGISDKGPVPRIDIRESVAAMVETLSHDEDDFVRAWSAQALGHVAPPSEGAVAALIAALEDPWVGVRLSACGAVATLGPIAAGAAPALVKLFDDENDDMRRCAKAAVGKITGSSP